MSKEGASVNLSEFLNDDDSEGHRFVDFLKKRRGVNPKKRYLFMDCETDAMSFEVQLEKLPTPQTKQIEAVSTETDKTIVNENTPATEGFEFSKPHDLPPRAAIAKRQSGVDNKSPIQAVKLNNLGLRTNGLVSPSDKLRRLSIKNYSSKKLTGGRRTLLQEFENTIGGKTFNPTICSTPILQPADNEPSPLSEIENNEPNNAKNSISSGSRCEDTETLANLQRKDAELKEYLGSILHKTLKNRNSQSQTPPKISTNNTNDNRSSHGISLRKCTFTVEKGNVPGQLVLTPDRSNAPSNRSSPLQPLSNQQNFTGTPNLSKGQQSVQNCKPTADESVRHVSSGCSLSQKGISIKLHTSDAKKQSQIETELQRNQSVHSHIPNSPNKTLPTSPTSNAEIPETQVNTSNNNIVICSAKQQSIVLSLLNQTVTIQEKDNNNENLKAISGSLAVQHQSLQQVEDNLKLTDILTDDEDDTPKATLENAQSTSEMPLNLAQTSYNLRNGKQLRKRALKHKLDEANSQQLATETEVELPPPAHSNRQVQRRKCYKPLNKAPGIPLNGEKYAEELARMSNHEILDLRKRNSLGQIFAVIGRPSRRSLQEASKKKRQLDDQIKQELLKRNLVDQSCQLNEENVDDGRLSVPYDFRDSLAAQKNDENIFKDSTFLQETSSDRVKFKDNKNSNNTRTHHQKMPEVLQQYLEVSKRYSKGKRRSRTKNVFKRSLFKEQVDSEFDEHESFTERIRCTTMKTIPYLKSPPKSSDLLTTPKVVSPPPVVSTSPEMLNTSVAINRVPVASSTTTNDPENAPHTVATENLPIDMENLTLPPPPVGFESDTNEYAASVTLDVGDTAGNKQNNMNTNNDDQLFKKPLKPQPKRKVKKTSKPLNVPQESTTDDKQSSVDMSSDLTEGGSLRRSKRGQVPISQAPIVKILYEKEIKRMEMYAEKRKAAVKRQRKEERQHIKSYNSQTSNRTTNSQPSLVPEVDGSHAAKSAKKTKSSKTKNKKTLNVTQNESDHLPSDVNAQCSHPIPYTSKPAKYPNNVFDQLRENTLTANEEQGTEPKNDRAPITDGGRSRTKSAPRAKSTKTKSKQAVKTTRNKVSQLSSDGNTECSRLILDFSPQVQHLNNMFDQLRENTLTANEEQGTEPKNDGAPITDGGRSRTKSAPRAKSTKTKSKQAVKTTRNEVSQLSSDGNAECSRLILDSSPQVQHLNNMFDQLRENSMRSNATATSAPSQLKIKPIQIRLRRLESAERPPIDSANETSSSTSSNSEFVSWLKNITKPYEDTTDEALKDGRISSATHLCFTELQGVEYAFYDTAVKASLGYLRFKPRQVKTKKKAKLFDLHFINLMGLFRITVNNSENILRLGDMAAVEKLAYYDIENLTDDIGILMVIKK